LKLRVEGFQGKGMLGDWFVDLLTSEAEKLIGQLASRQQVVQATMPSYWWVPGLPERLGDKPVTAAVDGGGGIVPLSPGGALYIARAYGYVEGEEPERVLELRVYPARDTRVLDALRSWVEHRAATRLVLRLPPGSVILMDGSLWAIVVASLASMVRASRRSMYGIGSVYASILSMYTLIEVSSLIEHAGRRGISIVYVSKDHAYKALKEKVLLSLVASSAKHLSSLVDEALSWYPLTNRERLVEERRNIDVGLRPLYDLALDLSYRDIAFIDDVVGYAPGYSWITRMPLPRKLYRELVGLGGIRAFVERVRNSIVSLLDADEEAAEVEALSQRLVAALDSLPSINMFYLRPVADDEPMLVEVPGEPGGLLSPGRVLSEHGERTVSLVSLLVSHYANRDYYNIPLVAAHINATLSARQLLAYTRLVEQLALARGLDLRVARRVMMSRSLPQRRRQGRGSP